MKLSSLQKGLVLHVPLDQESYNPTTRRMTDKSAYGNHSTSVNAANFTIDRMGQSDRAINFNGTSDYIDIPNISNTAELSVFVWIKTTRVRQWIINKRPFDGSGEWQVHTYSGVLCVDIMNLGNMVGTALCTQSYADGEWHHVGFTTNGVNGGYVTAYADNEPVGTAILTGDMRLATTDIKIGATGWSNVLFYGGQLAECTIYNRILSAPEQTLLYESYRPRTVIKKP